MFTGRETEIRIEAERFRQSCCKARYGLANIFADCVKHGYKLLRMPLAGNSLGFSLKIDEDTVIFTNSAVRLSREIFTLAHEIGHAVLHLGNTEMFQDDERNLSEGGSFAEAEANFFAACLLMPKEGVAGFLELELRHERGMELSVTDVAKLMSEFSVSFEMALNRLEALGFIDSHEKLRLNNVKTIESVAKLLKVTGGNQKLNEVSNCTEIPAEYLDYAIYNYNKQAVSKQSFEKLLGYYGLTLDDIKDRLVVPVQEDDFDVDEYIGRFES